MSTFYRSQISFTILPFTIGLFSLLLSCKLHHLPHPSIRSPPLPLSLLEPPLVELVNSPSILSDFFDQMAVSAASLASSYRVDLEPGLKSSPSVKKLWPHPLRLSTFHWKGFSLLSSCYKGAGRSTIEAHLLFSSSLSSLVLESPPLSL